MRPITRIAAGTIVACAAGTLLIAADGGVTGEPIIDLDPQSIVCVGGGCPEVETHACDGFDECANNNCPINDNGTPEDDFDDYGECLNPVVDEVAANRDPHEWTECKINESSVYADHETCVEEGRIWCNTRQPCDDGPCKDTSEETGNGDWTCKIDTAIPPVNTDGHDASYFDVEEPLCIDILLY